MVTAKTVSKAKSTVSKVKPTQATAETKTKLGAPKAQKGTKAFVKTTATKSVAGDKSSSKSSGKTQTKPVTKSKAASTSKPLTKSKAASTSKPATKSKAPNSKELKLHRKRVKDTEVPDHSSDVFKKVSDDVAQEELDLLCKLYPEADCELDHMTPFQLITSVIMSAQTTDANVNKVTPNLFRKYPDAKALAEADLDDIKNIIRSTGYYNSKATNIQNCARKLVEKFGGEVPKTIEELTTLPGVGRKTANVVLGVCFGVPGWTVDTHVQRLSKRLGLTNEQDPEKIEYALQKLFPNKDWSKYSITLIWHGRRMCYARKPECTACPINHLCPSSLAPVR